MNFYGGLFFDGGFFGAVEAAVVGGGDSRKSKRRKKPVIRSVSNFSAPQEEPYPSIPIEVKQREIAEPPDDEDVDDQILIALVSRLIH